jgi:ABC-type lipoprotein export system ATPase subunit
MRITELQLQNFKFFTGNVLSNTLKLPNGENVLAWGENGSGKSSIYWAIYTLLQCSYKEQADIDNYFTPAHEKNLVNIHKPEADRAFIRMALDDGNEYKIELADYSVIGNTDLQQSAVSSDFIDYNVVASFLRFMHKHQPEQMPLFEEQIFRFMPFNAPAPYTAGIKYFDKAYEKINEELQKDPVTNKYPTAGSTTYDQYKNLVDEFNRQLRQELGLVTVKANQILERKFSYPIEIELSYTPIEFRRTNTQFKFTQEASIILKINNYYGHPDAVKRPHSFLNEAKKTAIGLSIRLGILERRLLADKLNVLALDDLLISLDMSNREVVLKLLFEDYERDYQLLIFTHDKQLFNIAKHKIEHGNFTHEWKFWEFYVNEKDPAKPEPRFFDTKSQLSVAFSHLQENDYPAAANYLRKHCEHLIETYLPQYCYRDVNKDKSHKNYPLDGMITNSILFLDRINGTAPKAKLTDLKQYVEMLLNPLSHTERGVERHKGEIKIVIKTLEELETELKRLRFSKMPIVPINTDLFLTLVKDANNTFKIQIKLKEDLFVYDEGGTIKLSKCLTDSVYYWHYQNNAIHQEGNFAFHQNKELAISYNDIAGYATIAVPVIPNWETLYFRADGTILNTLMVL